MPTAIIRPKTLGSGTFESNTYAAFSNLSDIADYIEWTFDLDESAYEDTDLEIDFGILVSKDSGENWNRMYGAKFRGVAPPDTPTDPVKLGTTRTDLLAGNQVKMTITTSKEISIGLIIGWGRH